MRRLCALPPTHPAPSEMRTQISWGESIRYHYANATSLRKLGAPGRWQLKPQLRATRKVATKAACAASRRRPAISLSGACAGRLCGCADASPRRGFNRQPSPLVLVRLGQIPHGNGRLAMAVGSGPRLRLAGRLRALGKLADELLSHQPGLLISILDGR